MDYQVQDISEHIRLISFPENKTDAAVIAFGGIGQGVGLPPFEFFNTFSFLGVPCLFVRDPHRSWYQSPIEGLGDTLEQKSRTLKSIVQDRFPNKKIICTGVSMGGWAAILFKAMCNFDRAVAFSPQTIICPHLKSKLGDTRFTEDIEAIKRLEITDLMELYCDWRQVDIYYGELEPLDKLHAVRTYMANLIELKSCPHNTALWLKLHNQLEKAILG